MHQWADVFTRSTYVDELLVNLRYCQEHKGLEIFAWVVMSNHVHLIVRAKNENLRDVIRDLKKHTTKSIYRLIESNSKEKPQRLVVEGVKLRWKDLVLGRGISWRRNFEHDVLRQ